LVVDDDDDADDDDDINDDDLRKDFSSVRARSSKPYMAKPANDSSPKELT